MRKHLIHTVLILALLAAGAITPAFAGLERVGPVLPATDGYPAWYQDTTGLALEFGRPINQVELNDGWCLILPADVPNGAAPETAFTNYAEEHFYWAATAGSRTGNAILVLALEAAFGNGPAVAGDQVVFGRLRITIPNLPVSGDYKVYTPFGDFDFPGQVAGDRLFFTSDIGITCGTSFECALTSQIGPFLLASATPGGAEMVPLTALNPTPDTDPAHFGGAFAPTPYPGTGKSYIADPARIGPVTGSPLPPFIGNDGVTYNHNVFRIEAPGFVLHEENFSLMGRVMTSTIPGRVTVNRASYMDQTIPAALKKLDVFATAFPTTQGRLPGDVLPPAANPDLGFYDAPCATDSVTGAVTGPPSGVGLLYHQMLNSGNNWWGQNEPLAIPPQVCVQDLNARNAAGQLVGAYFMADVADEVDITVADWDPTLNGGTLTVAASSSDQVTAPALTVTGFGAIDPLTGQFQVSNLTAPPAKVSVVSTRGGVAVRDVRTGLGIPVIQGVPVANADSGTTLEDTPLTNVNVLANDTFNGLPIDPSAAIVAISAPPRLGSAAVNADKSITYTPSLNANGTDIIGYKVTVGGAISNEGYLTVIITPVNDPPVANGETTGTTNNRAITINVLANDTDPDGPADLAAAVNVAMVSSPVGGIATLTWSGLDGLVTFTPSGAGTYSFTYQAQDQFGVLSNTATVTVNVNAAENIGIQKSQYVVSKNRWRVEGTISVSGGQTLTIAYNNGTFADGTSAVGYPIGTAIESLGLWVLDQVGTGRLNPADGSAWQVRPTRIQVTSPLGGSATANISLK